MALAFPNKDPEEVLEYSLNFSTWVGDDVMQSSGTSVALEGVSSPSGLTDLTVDTVVVAADIVVAWISSGTAGEKYALKYLAVDDNNPVRTVVRRATLKVKEK